MHLENKLKTLENRPDFIDSPEYTETNEKLDKIYQEKINGIRIESKWNWYEHRETLSKFFLSLQKSRAVQSHTRKIIIANTEANSQKDINNKVSLYYKNIFNEKQHLSEHYINKFLNRVSKLCH